MGRSILIMPPNRDQSSKKNWTLRHGKNCLESCEKNDPFNARQVKMQRIALQVAVSSSNLVQILRNTMEIQIMPCETSIQGSLTRQRGHFSLHPVVPDAHIFSSEKIKGMWSGICWTVEAGRKWRWLRLTKHIVNFFAKLKIPCNILRFRTPSIFYALKFPRWIISFLNCDKFLWLSSSM